MRLCFSITLSLNAKYIDTLSCFPVVNITPNSGRTEQVLGDIEICGHCGKPVIAVTVAEERRKRLKLAWAAAVTGPRPTHSVRVLWS